MQLQDALDRFVLQLEADGRSPHTIKQYRRHISALARWLAHDGHTGAVGDKRLRDLCERSREGSNL